eukprot:evm.model.scf_1442.3 EVM.evm.TU.scf_1442.3   scf_1442:15687-18517(-)
MSWADMVDEDGGGDVPPAGDGGRARGGRETDETRLRWRQKQIDLGKRTLGYRRYTESVPRDQRRKRFRLSCHPETPEKYQTCSKRSFQGQITKWRKLLHWWDEPGHRDAMTRDCSPKVDYIGGFAQLSLGSPMPVSPIGCWRVPGQCSGWGWYGIPANWGMYGSPYPWMMHPMAHGYQSPGWYPNASPCPSTPSQWSTHSPESRRWDPIRWPLADDHVGLPFTTPPHQKFTEGRVGWAKKGRRAKHRHNHGSRGSNKENDLAPATSGDGGSEGWPPATSHTWYVDSGLNNAEMAVDKEASAGEDLSDEESGAGGDENGGFGGAVGTALVNADGVRIDNGEGREGRAEGVSDDLDDEYGDENASPGFRVAGVENDKFSKVGMEGLGRGSAGNGANAMKSMRAMRDIGNSFVG